MLGESRGLISSNLSVFATDPVRQNSLLSDQNFNQTLPNKNQKLQNLEIICIAQELGIVFSYHLCCLRASNIKRLKSLLQTQLIACCLDVTDFVFDSVHKMHFNVTLLSSMSIKQ